MTKFKPMRAKGFQHPSGRPLRKRQHGIISRPRQAPDEPLTIGLRDKDRTEAIGFTVDYLPGDQPDDDEEFDYTREAE